MSCLNYFVKHYSFGQKKAKLERMFWADRIAGEIEKQFGKPNKALVIRDEKTLSGRVHVGSMRGVAIHGLISKVLAEQGVKTMFYWEHNDFDVMDDVPSYLPREKFEKYLGMLLYQVPSPEPSAKNYAEYFATEFQKVITDAGFNPQFYWGSELYLSGKMDSVIKEALMGAPAIRRIYKEVSGGERDEKWLPISVICPTCGKLATTQAEDFDGSTVLVHCQAEKVAYTKGCGFEGRVSPFGGSAKLPWKVEWAAKWKVMGVAIEGGGKDHSTKGGARDVANHISREVFHREPPFDIPYEFFLVGGKKMSSSKGRGSSAKEISDLLPAKIFRLALLGKDINQAFNFDPEGDTIPVLYDQYDKLALGYWSGVKDDYARLFEFVHPSRTVPTEMFLPRFSQVAFLVQMQHLNLEKEVEHLKGGSLTAFDKKELEERSTYAKRWLDEYAPEKFVFKLQETLPTAARSLSIVQKKALVGLLQYLEVSEAMPSGEDIHHQLHQLKEEVPIPPAELFGAIYLSFLGKSFGPKAGWFLSVLPRKFVVKRLKEATQ